MSSRKVSREKGKWLRVSAPGSLGFIEASFARYEILMESMMDFERKLKKLTQYAYLEMEFGSMKDPEPGKESDHVRLEDIPSIPS